MELSKDSDPNLFFPVPNDESQNTCYDQGLLLLSLGKPVDSKLTIFDYLEQKYGSKDVLLITDLPLLMDICGITVGMADPERRKAVASRNRILQRKISDEEFAPVLIHELGHLFGLEHHTTMTAHGMYCPMVISASNLTGSVYLSSENYFCDDCQNRLTSPTRN